jgi:hypothetical protein
VAAVVNMMICKIVAMTWSIVLSQTSGYRMGVIWWMTTFKVVP